MRTQRDRIRHAIMFEVVALCIVAPLGGLVFGLPMAHFGVVAIVSTTVAMVWNYLYNSGFDHALARTGRSLHKTPAVRLLHSALFEIGLLVLLVPFIAWYLSVSLWDALVMDAALAGFYFLYALAFNWAYDAAFPLAPASVPQPVDR